MRTPGRALAAGLGALLAASLASSPAASAHRGSRVDAGAVNHWSRVAVETLFATEDAQPSPRATAIPESQLYFGFVSAAVYDAVRTAHRSGHGHGSRHDRQATVDAAVATAAHDVLVRYVVDSFDAKLAAELDRSLAEIPEGVAKDRGAAIGRSAAASLVARRVGDGTENRSRVLEPSDAVGGWRPTPPGNAPMLVPWLGFVRPLLLDSPTQIRLDGPDHVTSAQYTQDFTEVKAVGAKDRSTRDADMTATALFWNFNAVRQFQDAMRDLSERKHLSAQKAARMFAAINMTTADSLITCWRAKYDFAYWRPLTAIREADTDGNDATTADPTWEPLVTTPPYPDYTSGHACITGSVATGLARLAGSDDIDLTVPSYDPAVRSRHYDSARAMIAEAFNARIWLGLHFRTAMEAGSLIGQEASRLGFDRLGIGHHHGGHHH
jgi:hypothetical protein